MEHVFIVWHVHETSNGDDDRKFIGVYVTREDADAAVRRTMLLEGFRYAKDGFSVEERRLGEDSWTSGYFTYEWGWPTNPKSLLEEWSKYDLALAVSTSDTPGRRVVSMRGTREALTFVSELLSTVAEGDENSALVSSDLDGARFLAHGSFDLEVVRVGPRRSRDYKSCLTFDSIRGIYDVPEEAGS